MSDHVHTWGAWRASRPARHPVSGKWYVHCLRDCASSWGDPPCDKGHEMLTAEVSADYARDLEREYSEYTRTLMR